MRTLHQTNDEFAHLVQRFATLMSERCPNDGKEVDRKTKLECEDELDTLRWIQKRVERRIALLCRRRNTFAHINTLPPELLVDIFDIYLGGVWYQSCLDQGTLVLVCQYWNHLVDTTPGLWTRIRRDTRITMKKIIRALEKSKDSPLHVACNPWAVESVDAAAYFNAICPHAHRWREADLWIGMNAHEMDAMTTLSAPLLESLGLSIGEFSEWGGEKPLDVFRGQRLPKLRTVRLQGVPIPWSSTLLCHLAHLNLSRIRHLGPSLDQLLAILSTSPNLESLHIDEVTFSGGTNTSALNPVQMPALTALQLRRLKTAIINRLLFLIRAPRCKTGELDCRVDGDPLETLFTSDVSHFFDSLRSGVRECTIACDPSGISLDWVGQWLTTLYVDNVAFAKTTLTRLFFPLNSSSADASLHLLLCMEGLQTVVDILGSVCDMKMLRQVTLGWESPVASALEFLAAHRPADGTTQWPCPGLEELRIGSSFQDDDLERVLHMLRRRQGDAGTVNDVPRPKPIRRLEFGKIWFYDARDRIAQFSLTYWPGRLEEVRRLIGPEGELRWYGKIVTSEGTLEDPVGPTVSSVYA